ncbi:ABC transporter permease subunit [Kineococcus sp. R8]|uniref:carbohydrate ABC transporter permease n=1 Tax=Kineococcus siccus TaxID=2696567 RepID=UPI0014134D34|nr:ABC transporter permease subunit [Kineococcus siccus]
MLFPVYWMVNASLQPAGSILDAPWFPFQPDLAGYRTAVADQGRNLVTSLVISAGSVVVCLLVATPAAYGLAQLKLPGGNLFLFGVLVTQMVPGIVVANALYSAYNDLGLLDSAVGLVLADATHGIPFSILIIRAFMEAIPVEITEAARIDGASRFRAFRSVVVPVAYNALITAGLFTFLFSWSDFLFALTLTTTDDLKPITLGIYQYLGVQTSQWPATMATAVLASVPAAVLLVAAQKYVAAGATGGAVK